MLIEKIRKKDVVVGVVGLGYVGLPLILAFAAKGIKCLGFDIDQSKVDSISRGESYIKHISSNEIEGHVQSSLLEVTVDFSKIKEVDAIILCVPTPLNEYNEPDLSYVTGTMDFVVPHIRKDQLLSLESTTYPGTCEEILRPHIEKSGMVIGEDFYLVYSPEREDPGNPDFTSKTIPKVLGGTTPNCCKVGEMLYELAIAEIVIVSSTQVAEFTKLLENIYRSVNIGLVNELKITADAMGVDIWEVINAAATKPFGFKAFYPGPGLGGHCIPIDPFYLTWKAREFGIRTRFIETAGEINRSMPKYVVNQTIKALNDFSKPVRGSKVLLLGLAYKEDVDDMRESPTFELMDLFKEMGAEVDYYDPYIPVISPTREHADWTGTVSVGWTEEEISEFDVVVISTNHACFELEELAQWSQLIVDTRNAMVKAAVSVDSKKLYKA